MQRHISTGKKGEEAAARFLQQKGFTLLSRNWRHKRCEVDIIAEDDRSIVLVEVKTLNESTAGDPLDKIGPHKERMLAQAASAWLAENYTEKELRFDIIAVLISSKGNITIRHYPDAFYPIAED